MRSIYYENVICSSQSYDSSNNTYEDTTSPRKDLQYPISSILNFFGKKLTSKFRPLEFSIARSLLICLTQRREDLFVLLVPDMCIVRLNLLLGGELFKISGTHHALAEIHGDYNPM